MRVRSWWICFVLGAMVVAAAYSAAAEPATRVYRISSCAGDVMVRIPDPGKEVVFKPHDKDQQVRRLPVKDGRLELTTKDLQSGGGWIVINPDPKVDYSDSEAPRLVELRVGGEVVEYDAGMNLGDGGGKVEMVFEDASSLRPFEMTVFGVRTFADSAGVSVTRAGKTRTRLSLDLGKIAPALLKGDTAKEMDSPLRLTVVARDRGLTGESCHVQLAVAELSPPTQEAIFLSDLEPVSAKAHGGAKRDVSYDGSPGVRLCGTRFNKSIMTHALAQGPAEATYDLSEHPKHRVLRAVIGVDDGAGGGSVAFEVYVDQADGQWKQVYGSQVLRGGGAGKALCLDLKGASKLRLVVTNAGDGHGCDHAIWANARLEPPK